MGKKNPKPKATESKPVIVKTADSAKVAEKKAKGKERRAIREADIHIQRGLAQRRIEHCEKRVERDERLIKERSRLEKMASDAMVLAKKNGEKEEDAVPRCIIVSLTSMPTMDVLQEKKRKSLSLLEKAQNRLKRLN